jgi:nucleotide-binding universal stress UspA family protein
MGSHGAEGLKEVFVGSNTEKVVRYSEIPVLVIKSELEGFKANTLLFATNLALETTNSYESAVQFAKEMDFEMKTVFINTVGKFRTSEHIDDQIEKFKDAVNDHNLEIVVRNDKNTEDGILNYAKHINADVVGIGTHGRKGIARLLNGSLSEHIVNHAKRPVITFKL